MLEGKGLHYFNHTKEYNRRTHILPGYTRVVVTSLLVSKVFEHFSFIFREQLERQNKDKLATGTQIRIPVTLFSLTINSQYKRPG